MIGRKSKWAEDLEWGSKRLLQRYEKETESLCCTQELTSTVRALINHHKEKLTDREVLEIIEEFVLHSEKTKFYTFSEKDRVIKAVFHRTRKELGIQHPFVGRPRGEMKSWWMVRSELL